MAMEYFFVPAQICIEFKLHDNIIIIYKMFAFRIGFICLYCSSNYRNTSIKNIIWFPITINITAPNFVKCHSIYAYLANIFSFSLWMKFLYIFSQNGFPDFDFKAFPIASILFHSFLWEVYRLSSLKFHDKPLTYRKKTMKKSLRVKSSNYWYLNHSILQITSVSAIVTKNTEKFLLPEIFLFCILIFVNSFPLTLSYW